jgi:hypothetical protein
MFMWLSWLLYGTEDHHMVVRQTICTAIDADPNIREVYNQSYSAFMRLAGKPGGHPELTAATQVKGYAGLLPLCILAKTSPGVEGPKEVVVHQIFPPGATYARTFGFYTGGHYEALLMQPPLLSPSPVPPPAGGSASGYEPLMGEIAQEILAVLAESSVNLPRKGIWYYVGVKMMGLDNHQVLQNIWVESDVVSPVWRTAVLHLKKPVRKPPPEAMMHGVSRENERSSRVAALEGQLRSMAGAIHGPIAYPPVRFWRESFAWAGGVQGINSYIHWYRTVGKERQQIADSAHAAAGAGQDSEYNMAMSRDLRHVPDRQGGVSGGVGGNNSAGVGGDSGSVTATPHPLDDNAEDTLDVSD